MSGEWEDVSESDSGWVVVNDKKLPMPEVPSAAGGRGAIARQNRAKNVRANTAYLQRVFKEKGPEAFERAYEAQNMPFFDLAMLSAGREVDKLWAGTKDIGNFLSYVAGDDSALDRSVALSAEQKENDRLYEQVGENEGFGAVGSALPYMITGAFAGPVAQKVTGYGIKKVAEKTAQGVTAARGGVSGAIESAATKPGLVGSVARKAKREYMDDINRQAMRKSKQFKQEDPYRKDMLRDILAGGALGTVEGGMHYDNNPIEGAMGGILGTSFGKMVESPFRRSPDFWSENERRLVEWAKDKGMKATPGMETGSQRLQTFEKGMRNDSQTIDYFNKFDQNNQKVFNREVANAIGMDNPTGTSFNPAELKAHKDSLSAQYDELADGTTGVFHKQDYRNLLDTLDQLKQNKSPDSQKAYNVVKSYVDQINAVSRVTRHPRTGKFQKSNFDGRDYQRLARSIKTEADSAHSRGDFTTRDALKRLKEQMDKGIESGMGDATAQEWKDLDRKFALTQMVIDYGVNPLGDVDLHKLTNHLMATDATRTLTEQGGKGIEDLQRLAKVDYMMRNQAGSGLSTSGFANPKTQTMMQSLLQLPIAGRTKLLPAAYMAMYIRGIPSVRGLGGIIPGFKGAVGSGAITIPSTIRALDMGTNYHAGAIQGLSDSINNIHSNTSGVVDQLGSDASNYAGSLMFDDPEFEEYLNSRER